MLLSNLFLQTNANKSKILRKKKILVFVGIILKSDGLIFILRFVNKFLCVCVRRCQECGVLVSDLTKHRNLRHDPASKIIISDLEPDVVRQDRWDLEIICCQNQCCGSGSIGSVCFGASRIWIRILLSSSNN